MRPKQKCADCGAIFKMSEDICPKCGSDEIYELGADDDISPYEFFDSPDSPCDTVGGI